MFFGGILARLRMLLTSALTNRLASSSSGKIPSSTEAMISYLPEEYMHLIGR
jgi:hypothetical protein